MIGLCAAVSDCTYIFGVYQPEVVKVCQGVCVMCRMPRMVGAGLHSGSSVVVSCWRVNPAVLCEHRLVAHIFNCRQCLCE